MDNAVNTLELASLHDLLENGQNKREEADLLGCLFTVKPCGMIDENQEPNPRASTCCAST
jgi:hypothetical protein